MIPAPGAASLRAPVDTLLQLAAANLLSPLVLFFALGLLAGLARAELHVPEAISKALSLYLMLAIGFKGGAALAEQGASAALAAALLAGVLISFLLPVVAFLLLRLLTRTGAADAAAIAAHYGSVSIVTFVAASSFLTARGIAYEGHVVAMLALMETPAIVTGLLLARRAGVGGEAARGRPLLSPETMREVLLSGSVVLLLGSFAIGWVTGAEGLKTMAPIVVDPFKAVLAVFLLDIGLLVGPRLGDFRRVGLPVAAFGLYMPLVGATVGLLAGSLIGLSAGGMTLVAVLSASASYIVVPAAMRLSLPQANPAIYVTLSLCVTFPFNLLLGIPLYSLAAQWLRPGS